MNNTFSIYLDKVVTPYKLLEFQKITIKEGKFSNIDNYNRIDFIDHSFPGYVLYPALINAHDHLLGSYYPRVGTRRPYFTWKSWDDDLKGSDLYKERSNISNEDLYMLGSYKNLFSGVTTVSDHIPHQVNDPFISKLPIRVLKDYALAHEVSSYDLNWGDGIEVEYAKAIKFNQPFITHIEEGFDQESMKGIEYLLARKALGEHTVLIHGIGLSDKDIEDISRFGSHLVWCPFSNYYMFERTARIKEAIDFGVNISIGTDSPMSGGINILDEIRFAKRIYYSMYGESLSDKAIVEMITVNPAKALRLDDKFGKIEQGMFADFIMLEDNGGDVYSNLVEAELKDISLIFYNARPVYADANFYRLFDLFNVKYNNFFVDGKNKIMSGFNPNDLLNRIRKAVGFKKLLPFFPVS